MVDFDWFELLMWWQHGSLLWFRCLCVRWRGVDFWWCGAYLVDNVVLTFEHMAYADWFNLLMWQPTYHLLSQIYNYWWDQRLLTFFDDRSVLTVWSGWKFYSYWFLIVNYLSDEIFERRMTRSSWLNRGRRNFLWLFQDFGELFIYLFFPNQSGRKIRIKLL